ncbi:MAG: hypothetical protein WAQ98_25725 [Blastocatellia bacterium]
MNLEFTQLQIDKLMLKQIEALDDLRFTEADHPEKKIQAPVEKRDKLKQEKVGQ